MPPAGRGLVPCTPCMGMNFKRETGDPLGRPSRVYNLLNGVQGARPLPAGGIFLYW